jgi:hypothetical protein
MTPHAGMPWRRRLRSLLVPAALCIAVLAAAQAREAAPYVRDLIPAAQAVGAGKYTWFGFHAYDAALFAEGGRYATGAPFALELTYARNFKGRAIADRSMIEIKKLGLATDADVAPWLKAMSEAFPDVREGDRLTGVAPAAGPARIFHNGKPVGELADERLKRAFFAIWLDPRTSAPELRAQLLGERRATP